MAESIVGELESDNALLESDDLLANSPMEKELFKKYLTFNVNDECYGADITGIKEILEYPSLTRLPMAPEFISGVINLRGNIVPVINIASRFTLTSKKITSRSCIIIAELEDNGEKADVGFVVDFVSEVTPIMTKDIEPAPAFGAKIRTDFISGLGDQNGEFIILLNLDRVLSIEELSELIESVN